MGFPASAFRPLFALHADISVFPIKMFDLMLTDAQKEHAVACIMSLRKSERQEFGHLRPPNYTAYGAHNTVVRE
jgi:hypothetical protein